MEQTAHFTDLPSLPAARRIATFSCLMRQLPINMGLCRIAHPVHHALESRSNASCYTQSFPSQSQCTLAGSRRPHPLGVLPRGPLAHPPLAASGGSRLGAHNPCYRKLHCRTTGRKSTPGFPGGRRGGRLPGNGRLSLTFLQDKTRSTTPHHAAAFGTPRAGARPAPIRPSLRSERTGVRLSAWKQNTLQEKTTRHPRPPFIGKQKTRGSVNNHAPPRFLFFITPVIS